MSWPGERVLLQWKDHSSPRTHITERDANTKAGIVEMAQKYRP
jgi:hypothetical protein